MSIAALHPAIVPTIASAIADGDLIDVEGEARRIGFRHRVLVSREAWADSVHWDADIEAAKFGVSAQEIEGRLRDVLWHALSAARATGSAYTTFTMRRVPVDGGATRYQSVRLSTSIGPDETGTPTIIIDGPL